ncbi:MAG: hypothetical protein K0U98_28530 [Deltaproteobacteria bacterium]|nr:hypothetical protein [Deltaproteobacteria bacterium]
MPYAHRSSQFKVFLGATTLLALTCLAAVPAFAQPAFSKSFAPDSIAPGGTTLLSFVIDNTGSGTPVTDLAFTDVLPAGVTLATPANPQTNCVDGTLSAPDGGGTITYSDGRLAAGQACTVTVQVTSSTVGTHMNVSGDLTSSAGNSGTATDDLTVAWDRPAFSKSFSPSSISLGSRSTLTFTIDNTGNLSQAQNMIFTDNLPTGMVVADPPNASNTCEAGIFIGGVFAPVPGSSTVTLTFGGGINVAAVAAGMTCTLTVDVIGSGIGLLVNSTGELTSSPGGPSVSSGIATASLEVTASEVALTKSFTDDPVPPGGTVDLDFTISNRNRLEMATAIGFSDDLDATLSGLVVSGALPTDPCGPGSSLSGTSTLTLSDGVLAPEGVCTFSVTLAVPAGAVSGIYPNTTSPISYSFGSPEMGAAASDSLFVFPIPLLTKTFLDSPVNPGDTTRMEFTITNTSATSPATDISFLDDLTAFLPFPIVATLPATPCGAGSSAALIGLGIGEQGLLLSSGTLAAGASCTFEVTLTLPIDVPSGLYTNTTDPITATVDAQTVTGRPASADFLVVAAPLLFKDFTDDPVAPGGTVTLEFTLDHNANSPTDATGITFTDDLNAAVAGLAAIGLPLNDVCGVGSVLSGTTNLTLTGGTLTPGSSCTFSVTLQVPAGAMAGTFTNTTSSVVATVGGASVTGRSASADLLVTGLTFSKAFTDDPVIPGESVTLEFTLDNTAGTLDATGMVFTDTLNTNLPGLAASGLPLMDICGTGSQISGTTFLVFTGGNLTAGTSCTFSVTVDVPPGAASGEYGNLTSNLVATIDGSSVVLPPAADALTVSSEVLLLAKSFTDDPVTPGSMVTLEFTVSNADATETVTDITFTDDLDAALTGLTALGLPAMDVCGTGSMLTGTSLLTLTGGTIPGGGSCTFSVTLMVPASVALGTVATNTTSAATGMVSGLPVNGSPASDDLLIDFLTFSKSFDGPSVAGGTAVLTFNIENLSATDTVNDISFTDDLDAVITGLVATGLPLSDVCGVGSVLAGTSFLTLSGGTLLPSGTCTIMVNVTVPAGAAPGTSPNTTSDLLLNGLSAANPATADLTIEPPPVFLKAFAPNFIGLGQSSTLTFTIDNSASSLTATALDFTDNLPAGVLVATPANASTTCPSGTITAASGTGVVSFTGGTVLASSSCTLQVDVTAGAVGALVNTTGDLTSSNGNSGAATATLTVNPQPGFAKVFAPDMIAIGGVSTLTFTIDNSASTVAATSLAFTDNLPAALTVATPAIASTTCTGGTITAASGTGVISYTGGSVAAAASCTLQVDVTGSTVGSHVNLSLNLTSSLGTSGTATDTLTINPPPTFAKVFAPDVILSGAVSTLTFTIDNSASTAAATAVDFTDNLPAALVVATPANASTTCTGGTITAASGTSAVSYTGGTVAASASCTLQVDITSTTQGMHVNLTGDLTSSLGNSGTATDTLTVDTPPTFVKTFSPDSIGVGPSSLSTLVFDIDNTGNTVAATALDFTDNLPANVVVATPPTASTTCTGGTITATAGSGVISYSGGTLAAGATCQVRVNVIATMTGVFVNTTGDLTSSSGNSGTATDTLTVNPQPLFSKVFAPDNIIVTGTTTLTFTIDNTASTVDATSLSLVDVISLDVTIGASSTTCIGGTIDPQDTFRYFDGTVAAGTSCTVQVDITVNSGAGTFVNVTQDLLSSLGSSGTATDTLTINGPPAFDKAFAPTVIGLGSASTLTFTIDNSASALAATNLDFTDNLPAGTEVATPATASTNCTGGTLTAASGSAVVSYTGGSVAAAVTCSIQVDIEGTTTGNKLNTTGDLTSSNGNSGTAFSQMTVSALPLFSKVFSPDAIAVGGVSTLTFTIDHLAGDALADNLDFTDNLPASVTVATPANASTTCIGGTLTAAAGSAVISYTGGVVGAGTVCTVQADVTSSTQGDHFNLSSDLTSDLGNSGPATDTLTVNLPPTFTKAFLPDFIVPDGISTLTFTIDNTGSTVAATSLAFTDNLPGSVVVANPANPATTCTGGVITAPSGASGISYSGGSVAAAAACTVSVDVTDATPGVRVNVSSALTSSLGDSGTSTDTLTVFENAMFTKQFIQSPVLPGGTILLEYTITNPSTTVALDQIAFTDDLDAALTGLAATGLPVTDVCGPGSQISGTTVLSMTAGSLSPGGSCLFQISLVVPGDAPLGMVTSTSSLLTFEGTAPILGGSQQGPAATATFEVEYFDFFKEFSEESVLAGEIVLLSFTLTNPDPVNEATGVTFTDDLEAVLPGMVALDLPVNDLCGAGSVVSGSSVITLTGGILPAGGGCSFTVAVQVPASASSGPVTNVTSGIDATVGGNPVTGDGGITAVAVLNVVGNIVEVPTLPGWGLMLLAAILALVALRRVATQQRVR